MIDPPLWRGILFGSSLAPLLTVLILRTVFHDRHHNPLRAFLELLAGVQGAIALYFFAILLATDFRPEQRPLRLVTAALFWVTWGLTILAAKLASEPYVRRRLGHACPPGNQACDGGISLLTFLRLSGIKFLLVSLSFFLALRFPFWLAARLQPVAATHQASVGPSHIPQPDRYLRIAPKAWRFLTWARATGLTTYTLALQDLPGLSGYDSIVVEVNSSQWPIRFAICQPADGSVVGRSQQPLVMKNTPSVRTFFLPHFDDRLGWYLRVQAQTGRRGPDAPEALDTTVGYLRFR